MRKYSTSTGCGKGDLIFARLSKDGLGIEIGSLWGHETCHQIK